MTFKICPQSSTGFSSGLYEGRYSKVIFSSTRTTCTSAITTTKKYYLAVRQDDIEKAGIFLNQLLAKS